MPAARAIAALDATAAREATAIHVPGEIFGIDGRLANPSSNLGIPETTDGGMDLDPGRYVLAFSCVGSGQIKARAWAGTASATATATCQPSPHPTRLYLTVHRTGTGFIQFAATRRETVAIAAELGKLTGG